MGGPPRRERPSVLRRTAWRGEDRESERRPLRRPAHRHRSLDQSRVDSEDASRQKRARSNPASDCETILRRMPDYINYICPQFSETQVNFQRVPIVDTSNPFTARHIPSQDESMLVIRFRDPRGVDFPYLLSMLKESFMSRANTIVCPGGKMPLAMQLIFTPMIWRLMERRRQA